MALPKQLPRGYLPYELEVFLPAVASSRRIQRAFGASAMTEYSARIWFRFSGQEICPFFIQPCK